MFEKQIVMIAIQGSILEAEVQAIVNAANRRPWSYTAISNWMRS